MEKAPKNSGPVRMKIEVLASVDSTNDELKRRIASSPLDAPAALRAERQTAGRGRRGRQWMNSEGALLMSIALPLAGTAPERYPLVNLAAAAAVCGALAEFGVNARIKWPNDVLIDGAKVCGILSDLAFDALKRPCAVIGIGINVNADAMPELPGGRAVSLRTVLGRSTDTAALADSVGAHVLGRTAELSDAVRAEGLRKDYIKNCVTLGRSVTVFPCAGEPWSGTAATVDDAGRLIVCDSAGRQLAVNAADVSVRGDFA